LHAKLSPDFPPGTHHSGRPTRPPPACEGWLSYWV